MLIKDLPAVIIYDPEEVYTLPMSMDVTKSIKDGKYFTNATDVLDYSRKKDMNNTIFILFVHLEFEKVITDMKAIRKEYSSNPIIIVSSLQCDAWPTFPITLVIDMINFNVTQFVYSSQGENLDTIIKVIHEERKTLLQMLIDPFLSKMAETVTQFKEEFKL